MTKTRSVLLGGWKIEVAYFDEFGRLGLEKDEKTALEMFRSAADGGNASAQFVLGLAYDLGDLGLEKDDKAALGMYRKATDGGNLYIPHSKFEY